MAFIDLDQVTYLEARHHGGPRDVTRFLVIHDMESGEKASSAEDWLARTHIQDKVSSVHFGVDSDSICCAVRPNLKAYHAAGGNSDTIGTEHPGVARQTRAEWLDEYGQKMLRLSAKLQATLCKIYKIEIRRATVEDYVNAQTGKPFKTGLLGHIDITLAAKKLGRPSHGHWDPGPEFPWDTFLQWVKEEFEEEEDAVVGVSAEELQVMIDKSIDARIDELTKAMPGMIDAGFQRARVKMAVDFGVGGYKSALIKAAKLGATDAIDEDDAEDAQQP